ncbi:Camk/camkl protein kinase, partial [Globisporangium splendens]
MLAAILPKMTGFGALWRVDPVSVLLPETAPLTHVKTSKVHAAPVRGAVADAISREKDAIKHKSKRMSIHDRLRAIMGDMVTEDELQQRFTFGRLLGSGATSKVYAAVDTATGREVAIKVFDKAAMIEVRRSMVADGDYTQEKAVFRVQRRLLKIVSELEISKSLEHPNIIKYLGAYETSHRLCIVHELVEGCDLLEHLLANGKMKEAQAAHVMRQLLSAVHYCHERHVYHRDLKLENVLITPDYHVKLIDFGLSEIAPPGEMLKTICGTPLYCSPEVLFLNSAARQKGFHGGPADVWSIGVLIFALLTGCAPFDDSNFVRLREDVCRNAIAYPKFLSDEVRGLLKSMLIFDAQLRPTVADILAYGWLQEDASVEAAAVEVEKIEESVVSQSNVEEQKSPERSKGTSSPSKGNRRRSLSCLSENGTEGTSSTIGSFEDDSEAAAEGKQQAPHTVVVAADAATKTHLSCLENDLDCM